MGEDNIMYLYVSSVVWLEHKMRSVEAVFSLGERFHIVSTSEQVAHLKSELFGQHLLDMEILDENPSPEEVKLIKTKSPEFYKEYSFFHAGLEKHIKPLIPVDADEYSEKVAHRVEEKLPPLFTENNGSDIISWMAILESPLIPQAAEIYIYANGEDFLYQKNIHPYLSHEWKYVKRGGIRAYDPAMFTQRFVHKVPNNLGPLVKDSSNTPEFLRARFIAILDEIARDLSDRSSRHEGVKSLLNEAKHCIERIEGKAGVETVTVMKRLFNETLHKFQGITGFKK